MKVALDLSRNYIYLKKLYHLFIWTNDFYNMLENEMLCSNSIPELCSAYGRFVLFCKSYDDFYRLAKILFKVISREINNFEGIIIC